MAENSHPPKKIKVCIQAPLTTFFKKDKESAKPITKDETKQNDLQQIQLQDPSSSSVTQASVSAVPVKKDGRSFQKHWLTEFKWLDYDRNKESVRCSICTWAVENNRIGASVKAVLQGQSKSWITGFCDWRKGKDAFKKHDSSNCHSACASAKVASEPDNSGISRIVSDSTKAKLNENRIALEAIFQSLLFLGRQGLALRGHTNDESNVKQLLILLGKQSPAVQKWLNRNGQYKWISPANQNEILETLSHELLRGIIKDINNAECFSVILDETTDMSNKEQVSLCVRYLTPSWEVREDFLGFHQTSQTDAETLFKLLKDSLMSLGLEIESCRGQCYDGAANMSGHISGLQTRVTNAYPKVLYVYCAGHQLNLVVQDIFQEFPEGQHALDVMSTVIKFIRDSPKRLDNFKSFNLEENPNQQKLRPLCPTRWVLRLGAIQVFLDNYESILNWLEKMSTETDSASRGKARSYLGSLESFSVYFMLRLFQRVLLTVNPVHQRIQSPNISVGECRLMLETALDFLSADAASEENFRAFFNSVKEFATKIGLQEAEASLPRGYGRRTKCLQQVSATDHTVMHFQGLYTSMMTAAANAIVERYPAEVLKLIASIENILLNFSASDQDKFQPLVMDICNFYEGDFDQRKLIDELEKFYAYKTQKKITFSTAADLLQTFKDDATLPILLPQIAALLKLYFTFPCTSCSAERSFSSLRRIKSYLRTSMTQQRLNHCALLTIHKEKVDGINLDKVINDWIDRAAVRLNTFSKKCLKY